MGFGEPIQLTLRVSGEEHTTLGWVSDSMSAIEYAYNLVTVIQLVDEGHLEDDGFRELVSVFRQSSASSVQTMNALLRRLIPPDAQIQLEYLRTGMSFTIKFGGLAKAIHALAAIFDPARRAAQQEDDRHTAAMNRLKEEDFKTEVYNRRLNLLNKIITEGSPIMNDRMRELSIAEQEELLLNIFGETARGIRALGRSTTEVVDNEKAS